MGFSDELGFALTQWFEANKRKMAWRDDPTPYHVWVSEIMLQQTRVDTVHAYYDRFMKAFPTVEALAEAPEETLLKKWEGLGYYSRARNLQKAAKAMVSEHGGSVPDSYESLLSLPGIGTYTAGAILSIAFHKRYPVVDGNVLRVLSRVLGRTGDVRDPKTKAGFEREMKTFLEQSPVDPSALNQGLMELGALVCIPNGKPKCAGCPWKDRCEALRTGRTGELPVVSAKPEKKTEEKTVFLIRERDRVLVEKRSGRDVLKGLYGFPTRSGHLQKEKVLKALLGTDATVRELPEKQHVFTHRIWKMKCFEIRTEDFRAIRNRMAEFLPATEAETEPVFVDRKTYEESIAMPAAFRKWPVFS